MSDLHQYLVEEVVEDYSEGTISRRRALVMLGSLVGSVAAAQLLSACAVAPSGQKSSSDTKATKPSPLAVRSDDPTVVAERVEFMSGGAKVMGYHARPSGDPSVKRPILLVCTENRGLNPHMEDVTRRFAKAGYCAICVDLLSREGGTAKYESDAIPGVLGKIPPERHVQDFQAALDFVRTKPYARVSDPGMIGYCFGGGVAWRAGVAISDLKTIVPYYGPPPAAEDIPKIKASVLAIYGGKDARINATIPATEAAMKKSGKTYEKIVYPEADHAFFNDQGARYNEAASLQAWEKTLAWLDKNLKT